MMTHNSTHTDFCGSGQHEHDNALHSNTYGTLSATFVLYVCNAIESLLQNASKSTSVHDACIEYDM